MCTWPDSDLVVAITSEETSDYTSSCRLLDLISEGLDFDSEADAESPQTAEAGDDSKCRSSDGGAGYDCWAGCFGDPFSCEEGFSASRTGESVEYQGQLCYKYTCLGNQPQATISRDPHDGSKCTDNGQDCCASETWGEPQTCRDGYVAIPSKNPNECPSSWAGCSSVQGGIGCYGCYPPDADGTEFVSLTVTMPYTRAGFGTDKKEKYKEALASAAATTATRVKIVSIAETRRRAGQVEVDTRILAADVAGATAMASRLGTGEVLKVKLDTELTAQGLSASVQVSAPIRKWSDGSGLLCSSQDGCATCAAEYGDPRVGGGPVFADLVGVACGGDCFEEASRWSAVAAEHGDKAVPDSASCQKLCAAREACKTWTYTGDGACYLKRAASTEAVKTLVPVNGSSHVSGGCGSSFISFPNGLWSVQMSSNDSAGVGCLYHDKVYGSHAMGSCSDAPLLEVHASSPVLTRGKQNGWFEDAKLVTVTKNIDSADECASLCQDRGDGCKGWSLDHGACLLRGDTLGGCEPKIGSERRAGVVSGLNGTCTSAVTGTWYDDCTLPRCNSPVTTGTFFSDGNFKPEGCYYEVYGGDQIREQMSETWMVISGGSNAILTAIAVGNMLEPESFGPFPSKGNMRTQSANLVDVVWNADFSRVFFASMSWSELGITRDWKMLGTWGQEMEDAVQTQLAKAPPWQPGFSRLTLLVGQYWENSKRTLSVVNELREGGPWQASQLIFYAQISQWYFVCGVYNIAFCNRQEIYGIGLEETKNRYQSEMQDFIQASSGICAKENVHCFVLSNSYDRGQQNLILPFNSILSQLQTSEIKFLDFFQLGGNKPEEHEESHASSIIHIWTLQIILNVISTAPSASGCPRPLKFGRPCFMSSTLEDCDGCACTDYNRETFRDRKNWECANARQCNIKRLEIVSRDAAEASSRDVSTSATTCMSLNALVMSSITEPESAESNCSRRLWCGSVGQAWGLVGASAALLLVCSIGYAFRKQQSAPSSMTDLPAQQQRCRNCNQEVRFKFCKACGTAVVGPTAGAESAAPSTDLPTQQPRCRNCNQEVRETARFCKACGTAVAGEALNDRGEDADIEMGVNLNNTHTHVNVETEDPVSNLVADNTAAALEQAAIDPTINPADIISGPAADDGSTHVIAGGMLGNTHGVVETIETMQLETSPAEELQTSQNESAALSHLPEDPCQSRRGTLAEAPQGEHLDGINMARLLASFHIVVGHLYAKGAVDNVYFFSWGYTWVPWFFMLSGYVNTHARLNSKAPEKVDAPLLFTWKRLAPIYPPYAFSLILSLMVRCGKNGLFGLRLPPWWKLASEGLLLQSLVPWLTEGTLQSHCWFLSCLVPFWLAFGFIYRHVRAMSFGACLVALFVLYLPPWIYALVIPASLGQDLEWYASHRTGTLQNEVNYLTVLLKFNPVCYVHVFVFGMVLSRLRHHLKQHTHPLATVPLRCGAAAGYVGLLVVFLIPAAQPAARKLSARLSVLMPLQGLVLLGLSPLPAMPSQLHAQPADRHWLDVFAAIDPVSRLFSLAPGIIGDTSYCQYLLQWIVYDVWPLQHLSAGDLIGFLASLLMLSMLLAKGILEPAKDWWLCQNRQSKHSIHLPLVLPTLTTSILVVTALAWGFERGSRLPPDYVRVDAEAVDLKLNWTSSLEGHAIINPSLLLTPGGTLVRAGRAHRITRRVAESQWLHEGKTLTVAEEVMEWSSALLASQGPSPRYLSWEGWNAAAWPLAEASTLTEVNVTSNLRTSAPWGPELCDPLPFYNVENNTLSRTRVSGPEDPKLVLNPPDSPHGEWSLAFSSLPPKEHRPNCQDKGESVKQMYYSAGASRATSQMAPAPGVRVACGFTRRDEKNWIAFYRGNQLHFVYSIYPHTVVLARPSDGACVEKWSTSSFGPVRLLASEVRLHGSATAVPYGNGFLALMHVLDSSRRYSTLAYTFEGHPPFAITSVSRPLPVRASAKAFASGLQVIPASVSAPSAAADEQGKVIVTYGVADQQSRALIMSGRFFAALFNSSASFCSASSKIPE